MDAAIYKHFHQNIKERKQLTGGYTFNTWLLVLEDGQKVIFRTRSDFITGGGRKIVIVDVFEREKFFYDSVNKSLGRICPEVYTIDGTGEYYSMPYQISEYLEGTPLNLCFDDFNEKQKEDIYFRIGEIAAGINKLEIDNLHPYILSRGTWEYFFTQRLRERLLPLIKNDVITHVEIDKIIYGMRNKKAKRTLSFLHLDMRFINMIFNNGQIFVFDAENCEFGDPLFELAVLEMNDYLTESFLAGYTSVFGETPDLDSDLFNFYKMERQALVLDVFMNAVKNDKSMTQKYLTSFTSLKNKLLHK